MSQSAGDLVEVADALYSEGLRRDGAPRHPTEGTFQFLDRVRQPYFDGERQWYEDAFAHYPAGGDRGDLRARFRSTDDCQHGAAVWELYQHELWRSLGWTLVPHPETPDGRRRDFLVERQGCPAFILECAVDNASACAAGQERRWLELWAAFKTLEPSNHGLMIHRDAIGDRSLAAGPLVEAAERGLKDLGDGARGVVLRVETDGWKFWIEATQALPAGVASYTHGGAMSMEQRLYNPIRNRVHDKSRRSSKLELPFVLALQIHPELPIVSQDGAVREALMGTQTQVLGFSLETTSFRNHDDGPWLRGGVAKGRGLSALLLHEGMCLGRTLPVLHRHPEPLHPFDLGALPFDEVRYDVSDISSEARTRTKTTWHEVFDLPTEWPGPADPFEGINTDGPMPAAAFWSPRSS